MRIPTHIFHCSVHRRVSTVAVNKMVASLSHLLVWWRNMSARSSSAPSKQLFSGAGKIYSPSIKAEETNFCFWNIICQTFVSAIEHSETIQYINWFWDNSTSFNKKGCLFETEGTMIWCLCSESVGIWWTINLKHRFDGDWIRMKITWIFREKFYELIADLIILVETVFKAFIVDLKTNESKVLQNCIKFCKLNHTFISVCGHYTPI